MNFHLLNTFIVFFAALKTGRRGNVVYHQYNTYAQYTQYSIYNIFYSIYIYIYGIHIHNTQCTTHIHMNHTHRRNDVLFFNHVQMHPTHEVTQFANICNQYKKSQQKRRNCIMNAQRSNRIIHDVPNATPLSVHSIDET